MVPKSIEHSSSAGGKTSLMNDNSTSMNNDNKEKYLDLDFYKSHGLSKDYTMLSEYPIATLKSKTIEELMQIGLTISTINDLRKIFAESESPPTQHHDGLPQNISPNDATASSLRETTATTITTANTSTTTTTTTAITTTSTANTTTEIGSSPTDNTVSPSIPCKVAGAESTNASALKPNNSRKSDHPDLMVKFSLKNIKGCGSKKKNKDSTDISPALVRVFEFANSEINEKMANDSEMETNRIINYWPLDEDELKEHVIAGACTECHNLPSAHGRMKTCSQCCLVWYCGIECQKKNWIYHKEFCKVTKAVAKDCNHSYLMEGAKKAHLSGMGFMEYLASRLYNVADKLKQDLDRDLDVLEAISLLNPKVCVICKDADPAVLKPCEICYRVFYCSKEHAHQDYVQHAKFCPAYLLTLQCHQLITTKGLPIPRLHYKMSTVGEYKPLTGTMKDYIPPTFDAVDTFVSEFISYPLSLLYALEHTGLRNGTKRVSEMKELTVLMCDPCNGTHKTMCHNFMWEYMFHLLPKLKKLNIVLCELTPQPPCACAISYAPCKPLDEIMCSDCKSRGCNFSAHSIDDYQKYKLSKEFKKPDVIFNHIATDRNHTDVLPDIPYADPGVPLVLVDSKNMIQDSLQRMRRKEKLNILLPLQLNPFSGIQPRKCCDGSLVYTNSYIVGVRRQIKRYRKGNHQNYYGQTIGSMLNIPGF